jgi:hypothetical protein
MIRYARQKASDSTRVDGKRVLADGTRGDWGRCWSRHVRDGLGALVTGGVGLGCGRRSCVDHDGTCRMQGDSMCSETNEGSNGLYFR